MRRALNYCEHFPFFVSAIRGCVSISCFASLVGVPVGIKSSAVLLKVCVWSKLNTVDVLISKSVMDSHITHEEFLSVNNVLREYNEMKEEIKNPKNAV